MRSPPFRLLAVFAAFVLSVITLTLNTFEVNVSARSNHVEIQIAGVQAVDVPLSHQDTIMKPVYYAENRYSTPQCVFPARDLYNDSLAIIRCLAAPRDPQILAALPPGDYRLKIFNFFRGRLELRMPSGNIEMSLNRPDLHIEIRKGDALLARKPLPAPSILEIFIPFLPALLLAFAVATIFFRGKQAESLPDESPTARGRPGFLFALLCATIFAFGCFAIGGINWGLFHRLPGFGDEMNYLMQARLFADGYFNVPEPPDAAFFRVGWMDMFGEDGKVWGFHPPGNSLILALGWLSGAHWLPVCLTGGALFLVQFLMAYTLFGTLTGAFICLLIFCTSHWVLSLTGSFMAHAPALLFVSMAALFLLQFRKSEKKTWILLACAAFGIAFTVRPLSAVLCMVLLPFTFWTVSWKTHWKTWLAGMLILAALSSFALIYTYRNHGKFELSYLVKGPEKGKTLVSRIRSPLAEKQKNLFRNVNEYQHRVHSFGIILNFVPFFVPLFLKRRDSLRWLRYAGYFTFIFYIFVHSALHWYGWKWEPRMLFEVSFIFFLLSADGVIQIFKSIGSKALRVCLGIAVLVSFTTFLYGDLPKRFYGEYRNYNKVATGVYDRVAEKSYQNSIILFDNEMLYAPYTPFNASDFNGSIIFAKSLGSKLDNVLFAYHQGRKVFISADGMSLKEKYNFYYQDASTLADLLREPKMAHAILVLPWAGQLPPSAAGQFSAELMDEASLLSRLNELRLRVSKNGPLPIVLVESATTIAPALKQLFRVSEMSEPQLSGNIHLLLLESPRSLSNFDLPGFTLHCFKNVKWEGPPIAKKNVITINAEDCKGEYMSALWESEFNLDKGGTFSLYLESDDGSALFIDDKIVLDNHLMLQHGKTRQAELVKLEPGKHRILLKYFNGPAEGYVEVGWKRESGEVPFGAPIGSPWNFYSSMKQ